MMEHEADCSPLFTVPITMHESMHRISPLPITLRTLVHILQIIYTLYCKLTEKCMLFQLLSSTLFHSLTNHAGYTYSMQPQTKNSAALKTG
jgi:hypothetical protein